MKRVLVTGSTGFIGRHTLPILSEKNYEIHAITSRDPLYNAPNIHWHKVDLLNQMQLKDLIADVMPSHLLHFAWYAEPGKYWTSPENIKWVQSSLELLQVFIANGGKRAVMAGTCAEYDWRYGYCSERVTPLNPSTLYGTCKHSLQLMLESISKQSGISSAWGRIFFLYGPYEHKDRLISYVIRSLLKGETALCTHGNQIRDFLYVRDVADAFVNLMDSRVEGPVNIGSSRPISIESLLMMIYEKIKLNNFYKIGKIKLGALHVSSNDPPLLIADTYRLTEELKWKPNNSIDQGLAETISWYQKELVGNEIKI